MNHLKYHKYLCSIALAFQLFTMPALAAEATSPVADLGTPTPDALVKSLYPGIGYS